MLRAQSQIVFTGTTHDTENTFWRVNVQGLAR